MNSIEKAVWKVYCRKLIELGIAIGAPVHHETEWCNRIEFDALYGTTPVSVELCKHNKREPLPTCEVRDGSRLLFELTADRYEREQWGRVAVVYVVDVITYLLQ